MSRDAEISRLQVVGGQSSYAGMRETFDQKQADEKIKAQERQLDFANRQNQELLGELNELKEAVGLSENKLTTD